MSPEINTAQSHLKWDNPNPKDLTLVYHNLNPGMLQTQWLHTALYKDNGLTIHCHFI